jgi:hypothetical protein
MYGIFFIIFLYFPKDEAPRGEWDFERKSLADEREAYGGYAERGNEDKIKNLGKKRRKPQVFNLSP